MTEDERRRAKENEAQDGREHSEECVGSYADFLVSPAALVFALPDCVSF